ncbi:MAG: T9SS type A sorting domain-containing protein [Flavobacteriales bacterium]|nr:T9SS type A sorting domain-containing protein [Flavobacteriales bacterium]
MAQTGPGGVGNSSNNIIWFAADKGVVAPTAGITQWSDQSGNGNHATQATATRQPLLESNVLNGYPAVLFDNDQTNPDYLTVPDNSTLEGMNGLTGFAVFRLNAGTANSAPRGILCKRVDPGTQNAYGWFLHQNGSNLSQHLDIDGTGDRVTSTNNFATGTTYLNGFAFHGSSPSNANDQILYTAGSAVGNRQESSSTVPNHASNFHLGVLYGHTGTGANTSRFNGHIAEVILYNQTLTTIQRTIVNNYLAAKYGTALASDDLYTMDTPANGNYDHEVAAIARSGSDVVDDVRGSGIVQVRRSSGSITNNAYLFWGHDNGALGSWGVTDMPASVQGRLQRVWRVSEVNSSGSAVDVGNVDLTFHLSGLGPVTASDLRLLVDTDNDGVFADETPIAGATMIAAGQFRFNNLSQIQNARRFTLATANISSTPLPVELLWFRAEAQHEQVHLNWATATEWNNAWFDVERSQDVETWEPIAQLPGAVHSASELHYEAIDRDPLAGTSYYRLRQTDLDGSTTLSPVEVVHWSPALTVSVYPVPFTDAVTVNSTEATIMAIELLDMAGRQYSAAMTGTGMQVTLNGSHLPHGSYFLVIHTDQGVIRRKVMRTAP